MNIKPTRILIADVHPIVRTGIKRILEETPDLSIAYEATNAEELMEMLGKETVEMVLMEVSLPGCDTFDTMKKIKQQWPQIPIVVFTDKAEELYALRLIRAGVAAFISKEIEIAELIEILRKVAKGKKHITAQQTELLAEAYIEPNRTDAPLHELLTDREFQILFMLASGLRKAEIADKLGLSKNTVGNHRNNILKKMKANSNSDLTRYAMLNGIIK
jgi:two-component system, NarL family, invasion response regulator UvrY